MLLRFFIAMWLCTPILVQAQSADELTMYLKKFAQREGMAGASFGLSLKHVQTEEMVLEWQSEVYYTPASVQKLITTAAAMDVLGPDFRFETQFWLLPGEVGAQPSLVIEAAGDPSLGSTWFGQTNPDKILREIHAWLLQNKVSRLEAIYADLGNFSTQGNPDTWVWADLGNYFGCPNSGLCFADNRTDLHFQSYAPGSPAKLLSVYPKIPDCRFESLVTSGPPGSGDEAWVFGAQNQENRIVRGSIPPNKNDFVVRASVPNPPLFALYQLQLGLQNKGISCGFYNILPSEVQYREKARLLGTWKSPPLYELVTVTNTFSNNLFAEQLLWALSPKNAKERGGKSGLEGLLQWIALQMPHRSGIYPVDGSGLSRLNGLSPDFLTRFLCRMSKKPWFERYYESLPLAGSRGTLSSFNSDGLKGNLRAKSGSMERVRAYAGYLTAKSGKQYALAAIINHFDTESAQARRELEALFQLLYETY